MTVRSLSWILEDGCKLEMRDEPAFTLACGPLSFPYPRLYPEHLEHRASACHGLVLWNDSDIALASVALCADRGATGIHERSLCVLDDRCFVAVGANIVSLSLPGLEILWSTQVDSATCFGVHPTLDGAALVSHGELDVSYVALSGGVVWSRSGADIFTGVLAVHESEVHVMDFNDDLYSFELKSGALRSGPGVRL